MVERKRFGTDKGPASKLRVKLKSRSSVESILQSPKLLGTSSDLDLRKYFSSVTWHLCKHNIRRLKIQKTCKWFSTNLRSCDDKFKFSYPEEYFLKLITHIPVLKLIIWKFFNDCGLRQFVTFATSHGNILDLIFSNDPQVIKSMETMCSISTSDHNVIVLRPNTPNKPNVHHLQQHYTTSRKETI